MEIIGWQKSEEIEGVMFVLAEDNSGKVIVFSAKTPEEMDLFSYGWTKVPYSPEEMVIKHGDPLEFESAKSIFSNIEEEDYAVIN